MDIKEYVRQYNLPFDQVKSEFDADFRFLFESEKEWLENLEDKTHLLKNKKDEVEVKQVIQKLKGNVPFGENDTSILSTFVGKVDKIVSVANRINNFKEGTKTDNGSTLKLYEFFNSVKTSQNLNSFNYQLNSNLNNFLPHIYSIIKHCQNPTEFPIYYKYWKNILREVLSREDDYDSMCAFYRSFPLISRHLNFATYLGTIGTQIAKNINSSGTVITKESKEYKYLKNDVISIERYYSILNNQLTNAVNSPTQSEQYWLYAPGEQANMWDEFYEQGIMALGWDKIGDLTQYTSRDRIKKALVNSYGGEGSKKNDVSANDDFLNKIKIGDIVIAKKGRGELLGYGVVSSGYSFEENRSEYRHIRKVDWKLKGNWKVDFSLVLKTLTDVTKYPTDHAEYNTFYERLLGIMGQSSKVEKLEDMDFSLNTILYGPPGTGKTHLTVRRSAEIITNRTIDSYTEALMIFNEHLHKRIEFITFHQNYSYEDFIQGLRPNTKTGDQLTFFKEDGIFKKIADRALKNLEEASAAPTELSAAARFKAGLDKLVDEIQDHEDNFPITDAVHIFEVEEDAFRYNGENWTAHPTGIRMKFTDLEEFYKKGVKSRKDVKVLENISGLAKQHATYYFKIYDLILKLIPAKVSVDKSVQRQNFVIVIDEINRANISRVFGELITLIEPDKRSHGAIPLRSKLPSGDVFTVPSNLYIIGTMNTADKSIALLDIALRRRFEFEAMYPKYLIDGIEIYDADILEKINKEIIEGKGHDFQIGHAYFMGDNKDLVKRMNKKVIPLLLEYYMNDDKEVTRILTKAGLQVNSTAWPLEITGKA
jgi:hypothetical protein